MEHDHRLCESFENGAESDLRRDALKRDGCEKIIADTVSGGKVQRPGLERVHDALRSGDMLEVWRLNRLGRPLKHLIELMAEREAERIGFQSVAESIDTIIPGGKLRSRSACSSSPSIGPTGQRLCVSRSPTRAVGAGGLPQRVATSRCTSRRWNGSVSPAFAPGNQACDSARFRPTHALVPTPNA